MECSYIQEELHEYLDGILPDDRQTAVAEHLSTCKACVKEAEGMTELTRMLRKGLKSWVDEGTCPSDVMAQIEQEIKPRVARRSSRTWWIVAGAAAVLLFVMFGPTTPGQGGQLRIVDRIASQLTGGQATESPHPLKNAHSADAQVSTEKNGVTVTVTKLEVGNEATRIAYTLTGSVLDVNADLTRYAPELVKAAQRYKVRRVYTVSRHEDQVQLVAEYEPVTIDKSVSFEVASLPKRSLWITSLFKTEQVDGPWQLTIQPAF